jgi:predicted DNA-binding transcriptional regulator YafY
MSKENFQKIKLLKLWEILCRESDEEHPLDTVNLIGNLKNAGIRCDRKTLYNDIAELNKNGYLVYRKRTKRNQYYAKESDFSLPELRILIDAVQAANFIPQKKTDELVEKIANLGGSYRADTLKNGMYFDTQKYNNESVYNNIMKLDEAINNNYKVSFRYFDYGADGNIVFRKEGNRYKVNPLALIFNEDCYYLVCYSDKYKNLSNYRIDRIDDVKIEEERIVLADCAKDFDIAEYRRKAFSMFTGEEAEVEIEFDKSLIDVMMDKFGTVIRMESVGEKKCRLKINVQISPVFFGWCATFGDKLKIVSPQKVIRQFVRSLEDTLRQYTL